MQSDEQEFHISMTRADDKALIYASDPSWIRKLDKLTEQNPKQFQCTKTDYYKEETCAKFYEIDKKLVTIRSHSMKHTLTDEQKEEISRKMLDARKNKHKST